MLPIEDPSAWRNFPKARQLKRTVGRPRKHAGLNQFYGYPAPLIAEWCCVALSTAHAYKSGLLKPSKPAAKLFRLHRDRLVLTPEWRGWLISPTAIVDPDGNETPRRMLQNYHLILQSVGELVRDREDKRDIDSWTKLKNTA